MYRLLLKLKTICKASKSRVIAFTMSFHGTSLGRVSRPEMRRLSLDQYYYNVNVTAALLCYINLHNNKSDSLRANAIDSIKRNFGNLDILNGHNS